MEKLIKKGHLIELLGFAIKDYDYGQGCLGPKCDMIEEKAVLMTYGWYIHIRQYNVDLYDAIRCSFAENVGEIENQYGMKALFDHETHELFALDEDSENLECCMQYLKLDSKSMAELECELYYMSEQRK